MLHDNMIACKMVQNLKLLINQRISRRPRYLIFWAFYQTSIQLSTFSLAQKRERTWWLQRAEIGGDLWRLI
jgi:hypothetical protein